MPTSGAHSIGTTLVAREAAGAAASAHRRRRRGGSCQGPNAGAGDPLRLVPVRRDEVRVGQQVADQCIREVAALESGTDRRNHYGVNNKGELSVLEFLGNGTHDVGRVQHSGLRATDVKVRQHRAELRADLVNRERKNRTHGARVLGRHARDYGTPVDPYGGEALEVRLDARAAAAVAPGNREGALHPWPELGGPLKGWAVVRERLSVFRSSPAARRQRCGVDTSFSTGP